MKTTCTCLTFARSSKLHRQDCPKYQAYVEKQQIPTPSERREGKHSRIKEMLKVLRPEQEPMVDEKLMMLLEMKKEKR